MNVRADYNEILKVVSKPAVPQATRFVIQTEHNNTDYNEILKVVSKPATSDSLCYTN